MNFDIAYCQVLKSEGEKLTELVEKEKAQSLKSLL